MFFRGWQKVIINTPNGTVEGIARHHICKQGNGHP